MMKVLLGALLALLLGCHSGGQPAVDGDPFDKPSNLVDRTNYSQCFGPPAPGISITGTWRQDYATGNGLFAEEITYAIGASSTTVTATCTYGDGFVLPISVTVPSSTTSNSFTISGGASNSGVHNDGTMNDTCDVRVVPMSWTYSIVGSCLYLGANGAGGGHFLVR